LAAVTPDKNSVLFASLQQCESLSPVPLAQAAHGRSCGPGVGGTLQQRDGCPGLSEPGCRFRLLGTRATCKETESIQWSDVIGVLSPLWRAVDVAFSSHFVMVAEGFLRSTHSLEAKFKRKHSGRACPTPFPWRLAAGTAKIFLFRARLENDRGRKIIIFRVWNGYIAQKCRGKH